VVLVYLIANIQIYFGLQPLLGKLTKNFLNLASARRPLFLGGWESPVSFHSRFSPSGLNGKLIQNSQQSKLKCYICRITPNTASEMILEIALTNFFSDEKITT
jgi:hypothetical protein